jgi:hypothetical protein
MQRRINLTAAGTTALVVAAAIGLGGCDILGPRACTAIAVPAVTVAVTDSATARRLRSRRGVTSASAPTGVIR